jgi:hypothetical protein
VADLICWQFYGDAPQKYWESSLSVLFPAEKSFIPSPAGFI